MGAVQVPPFSPWAKPGHASRRVCAALHGRPVNRYTKYSYLRFTSKHISPFLLQSDAGGLHSCLFYSRTGIPRSAMCRLACSTVNSP